MTQRVTNRVTDKVADGVIGRGRDKVTERVKGKRWAEWQTYRVTGGAAE